uniref:Uncharacterized protein n=1 Tax=Trichuris muris TaxID=70415 RepID=A0A5S6R0Y7_TRIMR
MVYLGQELSVLDYFSPLIVFGTFLTIVFIISATCLLCCCVEDVDSTVFSKFRRSSRRRSYTMSSERTSSR